MLKPLISLEGIRTRQDATELFLQSGMQTSVGVLLGLLPKVGPIDKILIRIQKCATKPQDFLVLTTSLSAAISIASVLRNDVLSLMEAAAHAHSSEVSLSTPLAFQFFSELHLQCNVEALIDLRERINRILDSELMMENKGSFVVIHHGFHEQLDAWKEEYECLEDTLREVAKDLFHKHGQLDGLSVVFIPEVGYLVELEENLISHAQITLPCDFERIFVQDSNIYFKCDEMRDLDEDIGDLDGIIKDTERMIVTGLEETILDTENELRECFKALSSLDCILSFADCAADLNFTRPHLIDDDGDDTFSQSQHQQQHQHQHQQRRQLIYIKDGRHPLQEIICEREFVRNDVKMDDLNRILCVTGPNYSGKSCYMRQVGLLVYMAHLGSFVPCSKAIISVTDQIFARVSTTETCSRPQSSYQLELTEMASILLKATPKSLVLIDEFGKGTNPASGIAILGAALKKLSTIRCKTVCTTHFLELFTMNVIVDCKDGIRARRMTIHLPKGDEEDGAAPLFKLEDGVASSSAGLVCAKNAGVAHAVIDRAKQIIQIMRARKIIRPLPEATKQQVPTVSESEKEMLKHFVSMDSWERSNDEDIMKLLQLLANLSPNG
jgi:DNA mismatch repair protein MSH5